MLFSIMESRTVCGKLSRLYYQRRYVNLVDEKCSCGRIGLAIVGEVTQAKGREVKGCGGIMSAMKA